MSKLNTPLGKSTPAGGVVPAGGASALFRFSIWPALVPTATELPSGSFTDSVSLCAAVMDENTSLTPPMSSVVSTRWLTVAAEVCRTQTV